MLLQRIFASVLLLACVGLAFDPDQRIALYCGLPFVALCYGTYFLTHKTNSTEADYAAD